MNGETLDLQCQHQQREYGRVLTLNLLQKLMFRYDMIFYVTIDDDADIRSPKSLHTFIYFPPHAGKIWTKSVWFQVHKTLRFLDKIWLNMFDKALTPFWKTHV